MAKFSVVEGMFGVNPEREDPLAKGIALAQLSPEQQVSATGYASGSMLGRGVAKLAGTVLGFEDEEAKGMRVKHSISQRLQSMGEDAQNPENVLPIIIEEFQRAGMSSQALAAATELRRIKQENIKTAYETAGKGAQIKRDVQESDPIFRLLTTGHYDPKSVKAYSDTGDISKLVPKDTNSTEAKQLARFNELSAKWKAKTLDPNASEYEEYKALYSIFRGKEVAASVFGETPDKDKKSATQLELGEMAELSLKDKSGLISPQEKIILNSLRMKHDPDFKPPEMWETQLSGYAAAGAQEWKRMYTRWKPVVEGKMNPPGTNDSLQKLFTFADSVDPNTKLTRLMLSELSKDPELAEYLSDMFSVVYGDIRLQSGAAITAHEFATAIRQFTPLSTDTTTGRKNKVERMLTRVQTNYDMAAGTNFGRKLFRDNAIERPSFGATTNKDFDVDAFVSAQRARTQDEQTKEWNKLTAEQKKAVRDAMKR